MNLRALQLASFLSLSALIFFALDFTAGSDELALYFNHHPANAPYLCVAKPKVIKPVV